MGSPGCRPRMDRRALAPPRRLVDGCARLRTAPGGRRLPRRAVGPCRVGRVGVAVRRGRAAVHGADLRDDGVRRQRQRRGQQLQAVVRRRSREDRERHGRPRTGAGRHRVVHDAEQHLRARRGHRGQHRRQQRQRHRADALAERHGRRLAHAVRGRLAAVGLRVAHAVRLAPRPRGPRQPDGRRLVRARHRLEHGLPHRRRRTARGVVVGGVRRSAAGVHHRGAAVRAAEGLPDRRHVPQGLERRDGLPHGRRRAARRGATTRPSSPAGRPRR